MSYVQQPFLGLRAKRPGDPEPEPAGRLIGELPVSVRRAEVAWIEDQETAADDADSAIAARPWRAVGRRASVALVPAILRPLHNVADHVVETESVRRE